MADYILWGKSETNPNRDHGDFGLTTVHDTTPKTESYEALLDAGIDENLFNSALGRPATKIATTKFSRASARRNAPPYLLPIFEDLWQRIDNLDYVIERAEQINGKRTLPIRDLLLRHVNPDELESKAADLATKPFLLLKQKKQLIELRREQYTLRDSYLEEHQKAITPIYSTSSSLFFAEDIPIYPINYYVEELFCAMPSPQSTPPHLLTKLHFSQGPYPTLYFNFEDKTHLARLVEMELDLRQTADGNDASASSNISELLKMWDAYVAMANLTPIQSTILDGKRHHKSNTAIQSDLLALGTHYGENYISTVWTQKVLGAIVDAVRHHREAIAALTDPSAWKTCIDCGRQFLRTEEFWVRKKKSGDGFSPRCKQCEKIKRAKKKE